MIFLEGHSGSGKSTAGAMLEQLGFLHVSFRNVVAPIFGISLNRQQLGEAGLAHARRHGAEALYPRILQRMWELLGERSSIRSRPLRNALAASRALPNRAHGRLELEPCGLSRRGPGHPHPAAR